MARKKLTLSITCQNPQVSGWESQNFEKRERGLLLIELTKQLYVRQQQAEQYLREGQ